jgi:hypothetical protein
MTARRKAARRVILCVAAVFAAYLAFLAYGDRKRDRGFRGLSEGATKEQVVAALGAPDDVRSGCRDLPTWMNRPIVGVPCAEELEYRAKLRPVFWTVGLDEQGRAIAKYRYVSR